MVAHFVCIPHKRLEVSQLSGLYYFTNMAESSVKPRDEHDGESEQAEMETRREDSIAMEELRRDS